MQEHHIYWVALNRVKGIGAVRLRALLDCFGDARAAWEAQPVALAAAGLTPLTTLDELLQVLDLTQITQQKSARVVLPENSTEALLFGLLGHEPLHINEIGALAEMPSHQVSSALALMELKGLVRQVGGMSYVAARELPAEYNVEAKTE